MDVRVLSAPCSNFDRIDAADGKYRTRLQYTLDSQHMPYFSVLPPLSQLGIPRPFLVCDLIPPPPNRQGSWLLARRPRSLGQDTAACGWAAEELWPMEPGRRPLDWGSPGWEGTRDVTDRSDQP